MSGKPTPTEAARREPTLDKSHAEMLAKYMNYEQYPESSMRSSLKRLKFEGLASDQTNRKQAGVRASQEADSKRPKVILRLGKK